MTTTSTDDGGPAFPHPLNIPIGTTLRDYFAAKALQGMCAAHVSGCDDAYAEWAYRKADAMLKARQTQFLSQ